MSILDHVGQELTIIATSNSPLGVSPKCRPQARLWLRSRPSLAGLPSKSFFLFHMGGSGGSETCAA